MFVLLRGVHGLDEVIEPHDKAIAVDPSRVRAGKDCSGRSVRLQTVTHALSPEHKQRRQVIASPRVTVDAGSR